MYYIGIDIGGTNLKGGIVDGEGNIVAKSSVPTKDASSLVDDLVGLTYSLLEISGLKKADVCAVGMGVPGTVDTKTGVVKYSNNLKMENLSIVKEYRSLVDLPVYIGNDADAAVLGEARFGSGKGVENIVFVTLGTGVGTGIIVGGRLLEGAEGGHISLVLGGNECTCGRRGCFEAYSSATALKRMTAKACEENPDSLLAKLVAEEGISGKTAFDCAKRGDAVAASVVDTYLDYLSEGIVSLANVFYPEIVLLGGGISNEAPLYFNRVEKIVNERLFGRAYRNYLSVRPASLKNDAGILGAVSLAMCQE